MKIIGIAAASKKLLALNQKSLEMSIHDQFSLCAPCLQKHKRQTFSFVQILWGPKKHSDQIIFSSDQILWGPKKHSDQIIFSAKTDQSSAAVVFTYAFRCKDFAVFDRF